MSLFSKDLMTTVEPTSISDNRFSIHAKLTPSPSFFLRLLEMRSKATKTAVRFNFLIVGFSLRDRNRLKLFIVSIFKAHGKPLLSINYVFCSDRYLLKINQTH